MGIPHSALIKEDFFIHNAVSPCFIFMLLPIAGEIRLYGSLHGASGDKLTLKAPIIILSMTSSKISMTSSKILEQT